MPAAVGILADALNITAVWGFRHTTKKIFFLVLNCFIWRKKCQAQNLPQITFDQIRMKILCESHHKNPTNSGYKNVTNITLIHHF
ncbi:hypothetical protein CIT292_10390 [Citrobacter youngae ATCC 29220]|uniref:Uncharacterized protein n=1 Tax=Citrobacter youngae ATCC 29220 TaxID=500640 RepID=D4BIM3_9ENTR|nr:hypothetical protein CIT292_10390 [Citrobacter youngae ATCC 29220]